MNLLTKSYDLVLKHRSELWIAVDIDESISELKQLVSRQKDEWDSMQNLWFQRR